MSTLAKFQDVELSLPGADPVLANRLWSSSGVIEVSGSAPGNSKYYGTNASGIKGYFDLPSSGDVVGPSSSIDSEIALFNSTTGKLIKRATGSGLAVLTAGVLSTTTNNSSNWDTAFTERHQWDGGATNLVAATGRTSLGLVIGTNVQAWDADLDTLAGLTATTNNFIVSVGSAWASRTPTQVKSTLAIANTDVSGLGTASTLASDIDGTLATNSDSRIATQKAVKTYVDGINAALLAAIAALDSKDEVAYCATAALPTCNYANGTLGVGATLTATTNGPLIIDGVTTVLGAQGLGVLVAGQASDFQNGWYTLTQQGVIAVSPWILTRRTPDDQAAEIGPGYLTAVEAPTGLTAGSNNQKVFISIAPTPFVVGTDSLTFAMVGGTYTAGNGLTLSGTAFSINTSITADLSTAQSLTNKKLGSLTSNGFVKTGSGDGTLSVDTASYQPLDSDLTTIAGLTATTDNFIISVASAWASRTPAQARTTLGLVIGTNVQAWDADLDTLAGLTATTDNFIVSVSSAWASRTPSQVRTTLGLVIGTNVQAYDADLDTWAGITPGTGIGTFLATPSSANLLAAMTDETGTGACVFAISPTLVTPILGTPTSGTLSNCGAATDSVAGVMSAADHTTLTSLSGPASSGAAPGFVGVAVPVIAYKTGVDLKTNATTDIFTVPTSRTFVVLFANVIPTSVTGGAAVAFVYKIVESGAAATMIAGSAGNSTAPGTTRNIPALAASGSAPFTVCAAGNKVQIQITTGFTTSTTVTGTVWVWGYYIT